MPISVWGRKGYPPFSAPPPSPSQVVVATAATCWGMTSAAHLVVVMGTQFFDASGSGSSDYPVTDLLQMMGRASRPNIDDSGEGGVGAGGDLGATLCTGLAKSS